MTNNEELIEELQDTDLEIVSEEEAEDSLVIYEGEVEGEEGEITYIRVIETPDGFVLLAEAADHGGAIIDVLPTEEMAVSRAQELVDAMNDEDDGE